MNAMNRIRSANSMPAIASVDAAHDLTILVSWKAGSRAGKVERIDLSPLVNSFKFYRPLRNNSALFRSAHLADDGQTIAWGQADEIDMAATSVERLAEEAMTSDDFRAFLTRHDLTHGSAAAILGRSRRQIEYYLAEGEIPRVVVLACYGYEARRATPLSDTAVQQCWVTISVDSIRSIAALQTRALTATRPDPDPLVNWPRPPVGSLTNGCRIST